MSIEKESIVHGTLTARYVVGFMFSQDRKYVALIRKQKPEWQKGLLNGVGGKIEPEETGDMAMAREFSEETGHVTVCEEWIHYLRMTGGPSDPAGKTFSVDFFVASGDLSVLGSPEVEKIEITSVRDIYPMRTDMVDSVTWALPLALDALKDGRPAFVNAIYP